MLNPFFNIMIGRAILIIFFFIVLIFAYYLFNKVRQLKQQEITLEKEKQNIKIQIRNKQIKISNLNQQIINKQNKLLQLKQLQQQEQTILDTKKKTRQNELQQIEQNYEEQRIKHRQDFHQSIRQQQIEMKSQLYQQIGKIQRARNQIQSSLVQLKSVYQAATAARLRQQEEQNKISFYRIQISDKQINDIINLQEWKKELNDPSIVSKIIWSAFIMKPTTDLCNRVLGSGSICGIYKITNKQTGDIYIGQSVNVADRWKQHVKCGLGIDASATNKLYNNMQKYGVWNFTFEILQKCTRDKLNEKERFWIQMYQSNKVGLNVTKGNK